MVDISCILDQIMWEKQCSPLCALFILTATNNNEDNEYAIYNIQSEPE